MCIKDVIKPLKRAIVDFKRSEEKIKLKLRPKIYIKNIKININSLKIALIEDK
jgi:hypothetical protein